MTIDEWREEYANLNKISYEFYKELKEAKRLLKSATNVINMFIPCNVDLNCSEYLKQRQNCNYDDNFSWCYVQDYTICDLLSNIAEFLKD